MAKIIEHGVLLKFSKIVKDSEDSATEIIQPDLVVAQELAGNGVLVEAVMVGE